jgi:hypothetical protein
MGERRLPRFWGWLGERIDGDGALIAAAAFFLALGSLLLVVALTSSSRVQWTGTSVHGVERGGIVFYSYDGQNYSLDDTSRFLSHTVYLDPAKPATTAMLGSIGDRIVDLVSVLGPYGIAAVIIVVGVRRRRHYRRRANDPSAGGFGYGLDPEVVHRLIERRRAGRLS